MLGILESFSRNPNSNVEGDEDNSPSKIQVVVGEILGTATLMFLGCMGCITQMVDIEVLPHWKGLNFGLTVMAVIQALSHISGAHLNPQVSLGAVILGKINILMLPLYIIAQFIGAIIGLGLLWGFFVEVIITALLLLICGAVWDSRNENNTDSTPIRFGLFIALISMVAGPYTGASMNSARSLAPAILNNNWTHQWVYWAGPTLGAIIGSMFYRFVFGYKKPNKLPKA